MTAAEDLTTIRVDQFYPHSPARVWRALTTPALLGQWLMPNDFQAVEGHRFTFTATRDVNFSGTIACEVLEIRAPERLRISWRDADANNPLDSTVTFDLRAEGRGTRLILEHSGFDPDDPGQQLARRIMSGGWRSRVLRRLGDLLDALPEGPASSRSPER